MSNGFDVREHVPDIRFQQQPLLDCMADVMGRSQSE